MRKKFLGAQRRIKGRDIKTAPPALHSAKDGRKRAEKRAISRFAAAAVASVRKKRENVDEGEKVRATDIACRWSRGGKRFVALKECLGTGAVCSVHQGDKKLLLEMREREYSRSKSRVLIGINYTEIIIIIVVVL